MKRLKYGFFSSQSMTLPGVSCATVTTLSPPTQKPRRRCELSTIRCWAPIFPKYPPLLINNPNLLNQLPYTLAVIKETMRLFPPASSMREGSAAVSIVNEDGNSYPTEGVDIQVLHLAIQRSPKYWKEPDSFIFELWLVGPENPLYPVKGACRPFEFGSRRCIGQTLVMMNLRTVLAMIVREFDICAAYQEWGLLHPSGRAVKTVRGERRAYRIE